MALSSEASRVPLRNASLPRLILYHQTLHRQGRPVSLFPLIHHRTGITHVIIAALHLNERPGHITLNNDSPDAPKHEFLWSEVAALRAAGVEVLGMLGGAAQGTFARLNGSDEQFEAYYRPLLAFLIASPLSGIDLDVEEPISLGHIIRLIDRLRADLGPSFLITLAPVAAALLPAETPHSFSAFSYLALERARGHDIAWYHVQFYCGWGDARRCADWCAVARSAGWDTTRLVVGVLTHPDNGAGWVNEAEVGRAVAEAARWGAVGGVMGWEYFNALPGGEAEPWRWVEAVGRELRQGWPPPLPPRMSATDLVEAAGNADANQRLEKPNDTTESLRSEHVAILQELGFSSEQAISALLSTGGNVEAAGELLTRS